MFMDVFFGSKQVCGIYRGDKAIHGIMIDSKLYPGGIGMTWATRPSSGSDDWWPLDSWQKVYYNHIVHSGYGITLFGAQAYHTTVSAGGVFRVGNWSSKLVEGWTLDPVIGSAINTTVEPGGKFFIGGEDGIGFAENVTISSGGTMYVYSFCTATHITAAEGAIIQITVAPNTYIQGNYNGSAFEMKDAFISGYTINSSGGMDISSGGTANSTTIGYRGSMNISSGGTANSTTINLGGSMNISSGGTANSTTINSGGYMEISSGGTALNVTSKNGAQLAVFEGAHVTYT